MTQMLLILEQLFSLPTQAQITLLYDTNYTTLWDRTALYTTLQFASFLASTRARKQKLASRPSMVQLKNRRCELRSEWAIVPPCAREFDSVDSCARVY
jgi:hypothetical protein